MTDNLIGPKPDGPKYPTPWRASNWGNLEDANGNTLYFAANGVPMKESRKLGPAIVDAVNAYYGGTGPLQDTWVKACRDLDAKDARIVTLEGRAQVAEELVKKLQKEAGARNERWAIMVREVDKRDARIAELAEEINSLRDRNNEIQSRWSSELRRAQAAEERARELEEAYAEAAEEAAHVHELTERAEAAEARVNLFQRYHQEDLDEIAVLGKRAEAAEARLKEVDSDRWGLLNRAEDAEVYRDINRERAEKAEARVRELERYSTLGYTTREELPKDTFTAPDGRVFRVGQRVWHIWDEPGEFGHVTDINGGFPLVQFEDAEDQTLPDSLRRVWDGSEEPDVSVGAVLQDRGGSRWVKYAEGWTVEDGPTLPWTGREARYGPYVEHLPGDD